MTVGTQGGWYQGPRWVEDTLLSSDDLRVTSAPGYEETVMLHQDTRDQSTAALVLDANGYILLPGLAIYKSSTGFFSSVGHTSGNSPAVSPLGGVVEAPFGLLLEKVDMYDPETRLTVNRPVRVSRGGHHIDYTKIHDRYGNFINVIDLFTNPTFKKWFKGTPFMFSQDFVSPGAATP